MALPSSGLFDFQVSIVSICLALFPTLLVVAVSFLLRRKRFRLTLARPRAPATPMEINAAGGFRRVAKVFDQPHLRSGYLDAEGDAPQLTSKEI